MHQEIFVRYDHTNIRQYDQNRSNINEPYDAIRWVLPITARDYCLRIQVPANANPAWVQVRMGDDVGALEYGGAGRSILNPADNASERMLAVGAASWNTPGAIMSYSGRGPTNPGSGSIRIKPDIVGSANVYTFGLGKIGTGTSQAGPHVAGLAALVMEAFPNKTPRQVADYLKTNALPRSESVPAGTPTPTPSRNNTWGYGFAYLPNTPPTRIPSTPTPTPGATATPTSTRTPTPTPPPDAPRSPRVQAYWASQNSNGGYARAEYERVADNEDYYNYYFVTQRCPQPGGSCSTDTSSVYTQLDTIDDQDDCNG